MKRNGHITAFYLETLMLVVVFLGIILILTRIFGLGRMQGSEAAHLSQAVTLAQNAAEAVSAAESPAELGTLLVPDAGQREKAVTAGEKTLVCFDRQLRPDPAGVYTVAISWDEEADGFVTSHIEVFYGTQSKALYALDTAVFHGEAGA